MDDRWQLVLPHREYLLRLALSKGVGLQDAEDCVQEAMLRCVQYADLDPSRVVAFLTTIVTRLCADAHRTRARDDRLAVKLTAFDGVEPAPDERVCERAEAAWVSVRVAELPERQRAVLAARADGQPVGEIADRLAVSYKVVESALSRARAHLRAALVASLSLLGLIPRRLRGPAAAVTSVTLVALGTALLVVQGPFGRDGATREAGRPGSPDVRLVGPVADTDDRGSGSPRPTRPGSPRPRPTGRSGALLDVPGGNSTLLEWTQGPPTTRPPDDRVECVLQYWIDPGPPTTVRSGCNQSPPPGAITLPRPSSTEGS